MKLNLLNLSYGGPLLSGYCPLEVIKNHLECLLLLTGAAVGVGGGGVVWWWGVEGVQLTPLNFEDLLIVQIRVSNSTVGP